MHSVLLQGSIHQGDEIFSPDSRGHQCLPWCSVFLVKAVQKRICTNLWNVNNMNEILLAGDKFYKYAKKNSKTYHDCLEPCDLPSYFSLDNQHYHWKVKKNIISLVEYPFLDLETTLAMTFSFNPYAVFAFNRVFKESLLFRKYIAQVLDIFHRAPSYGVVLVALECHLSSLHVLCLHRRYTALHQYFTS